MATRETLQEELKIAVFGCWNQNGCTNDSGLKLVSDRLRQEVNISPNKYNFLVVLGDNYYPIKVKNKVLGINYKLTDMKEAEEGFKCLDNIPIEKKIIIGNHDIENHIDKDCSVLKSMLKLPWYDVKFPFSYDLYYIADQNILMFYLDTTLYDKDLTGYTCYDRVTGIPREDLKQQQHEFILRILEEQMDKHKNIKNIIFYGHEPLFAMKAQKKDKEKKEDGNYKETKIQELLEFIFDLNNIYPTLTFTWICADYHVYQNTRLTRISDSGNDISINQLIFGTGGGDLDSVDVNIPGGNNNIFSLKTDSAEYRLSILSNMSDLHDLSTHGIAKYGYGEITINSSGVSHTFINCGLLTTISTVTDSLETFTKEKRKYLKYKQKYLELKKLINN